MDNGHWQCKFEFNPDDWFGFIYRITELDTGREYIGKKQFTKLKRKKVKGRKNRKHIRSTSDWQVYTGSSNELNDSILKNGIDRYQFEIISLHKTKGSLAYAEVRRQIIENVLCQRMSDGVTRKYFNKYINAVKFIPPVDTPDELTHRSYDNSRCLHLSP